MANFRARFFANQGLITYSNQGPGFELDPAVGATNGGFIVPCFASGPQQLSFFTGSSAFTVDVGSTSPVTTVYIVGNEDFQVTGTMPSGTVKGQVKVVRLLSGSGTPASQKFVLTGSAFLSPTPDLLPTVTKYDFTFNDYVTFMWNGTSWVNIENGSIEGMQDPTPGA